MAKRNKSAKVNLRFEPELKELAERAAADDRRSLTSLIEKLLADYLQEKGFLPVEKPLPKKRTSAAASAEMAAV